MTQMPEENNKIELNRMTRTLRVVPLKMGAKYIQKWVVIFIIVGATRLTTIGTVQIVEVPADLHNWTFIDQDVNLRNETEQNNEVEGLEVTYTPTEPAADYNMTIHPTTLQSSVEGVKHICNRECSENSPPMICRYAFTIEHYQTMSKACYDCPFLEKDCNLKDCIPADGVKRLVTVVNRQLPGPSIEVCLGDTIEVLVENELFEETTTIHWHGQHQRGSQFMDGVPKLTQCPIPPDTAFVYRFNASVPGTHFWHSHSGFQRGDGIFGALIVRKPRSQDQYSDLFDYDLSEHVLSIMDWTHIPGLSKYVAHHHSDGDNKPTNILINGKGRYQEFENEHGEVLFTALEKFTVNQGYRYRFRLINAGSLNCPIEMSIDNHTLVIITGDGADLEPVEAQSLISYAGERFDFIVEMNQPIDNYWIRFRGLMDCDERFNSVFQTAILHYHGADKDADPVGQTAYDIIPHGLQVNSLNTPVNTSGSLIMPELRSPPSSRRDPRLKPVADLKFFISYDFYPKDNVHYHLKSYYGFNQTEKSQRVYTPQLNHISMKFPPFPLIGNLEEASKLEFCNSSTIPQECETEYCECIHILRVPKDAVVELIIIDKGFTYDANHPFHLHGYYFRVIGMDRLGPNITEEKIREMDENNLLMRNLKDAPIKDTVTIPDGGYTIVRWHATNPGYWLFHCHIEFHIGIGMSLVFKVGEDSDYPKPPNNFPRCFSFFGKEENKPHKPYEESYDDDDGLSNEIGNVYSEKSSQTASLSKSGPSSLSPTKFLLPFLISAIFCLFVRF